MTGSSLTGAETDHGIAVDVTELKPQAFRGFRVRVPVSAPAYINRASIPSFKERVVHLVISYPQVYYNDLILSIIILSIVI